MTTVSLTQDQVFTALRSFLLDVLPDGAEVVRGQGNRVPMPTAPDFAVITALTRQQMAQTTHDYRPADDEEDVGRSTGLHFQIDVYGEGAADNAQIVTTLLRDAWGVAFLKASGVAPLYCEDPLQMPLLTGEQQYLERWTIKCALHAIVAVTVAVQFADSLVTTLQEVK